MGHGGRRVQRARAVLTYLFSANKLLACARRRMVALSDCKRASLQMLGIFRLIG
jgi:hypothetical protein